MPVKDLINEVKIHMDQYPRAGSSDNTSDGTINVGIGVSMNGYRFATLIGMTGTTTGTSDNTCAFRLQKATSTDGGTTLTDTASDLADTDYTSFTTDALSATLAFATSDIVNDGIEGVTILHVDLWANGMTGGCIRSQAVLNGTSTAQKAAVIILSRRNGGPIASTPATARF